MGKVFNTCTNIIKFNIENLARISDSGAKDTLKYTHGLHTNTPPPLLIYSEHIHIVHLHRYSL